MKSKNILIVIILLVLIGVVVYMSNTDNGKNDNTTTEIDMNKDMSSSTTTTSDVKEMTMVKGGVYKAYLPEDMIQTDDNRKNILFFKANWCPSCRIVDMDIKSKIQDVTEKVTILEVDYDKSSELKKKYGVTSQHTFVQIDKEGNLIKKWSGGSTLKSVMEEAI